MPTRLPHYLWLIENALSSSGAEEFWATYPHLRQAHESLGLPYRRDDLKQDLPLAAAIQVFSALREDSPARPDFFGILVLNAARLDLQQCPTTRNLIYRGSQSDADRDLLASIGRAMNLPPQTGDYLCHISNRHKYLYVATPKVACTTIKHSLQSFEMDGTLRIRRYGDEHFPQISPLLSPLHNPDTFFAALAEDEDWLRFTFVRNPYTRVLSCYLDKIVASHLERERLLPKLGIDLSGGIPTFRTFLEAVDRLPVEAHDPHWAPQAWLTQPDRMRYHFVGRFERFGNDLKALAGRIGLPLSETKVWHSTGAGGQLETYYGADEVDLVRKIYAEDFARFDYGLDLPAAA